VKLGLHIAVASVDTHVGMRRGVCRFGSVLATALAAAAALCVSTAAAKPERLRTSTFRTPSGNIVCQATWTGPSEGVIGCWVLSTARPDIRRGTYAFYLEARGRVKRSLPNDRPGPGWVFRYGRAWRRGPFRCRSRKTGLRCISVLSGHGFYLAREFQRTF